jgi:hypothetical protein
MPGCIVGSWARADLSCNGVVDVTDVMGCVSMALAGVLPVGVDADQDGCGDACSSCADPGGGSCLIAGVCRPEGAASPGNDCQRCQPLANAFTYTSAPDNSACEGASGKRCAAGVCVIVAPGAPVAVSASAVGTVATVVFSPPSSTGGGAITSYTATCSSSNGGATRVGNAVASPISLTGLSAGAVYACTVRATNSAGNGPESAPSQSFLATAPGGGWESSGAFRVLKKDDNTYFSGSDCNGNFFGANEATVGGVPFRVGPYLNGTSMAGLPVGGITIPAPGGATFAQTLYMIFPGGRCTGQTLTVRFDYADGTNASLSGNVVHDCSAANFSAPNVSIVHQGNYGGPCCANWYRGAYTNPNPSKLVSAFRVTYADGCGGSYNGQVWALTLDPTPSVVTSCKTLYDAGLSTGDGTYTIWSGGAPRNVLCDMSSDGGGWTLVGNFYLGSQATGLQWLSGNGIGSAFTNTTTTFKFSDAAINQIKTVGYRVESSAVTCNHGSCPATIPDFTRYFTAACTYSSTAQATTACKTAYLDAAFTVPAATQGMAICDWHRGLVSMGTCPSQVHELMTDHHDPGNGWFGPVSCVPSATVQCAFHEASIMQIWAK